MSDQSVAEALRTDLRLVVVEAPAGCGKTFQAAQYAYWLCQSTNRSTLILTHTHAACDVFRSRTVDSKQRVHVTTIDGLLAQIAGAYHKCLGLPADVTNWIHTHEDGFTEIAARVGSLLQSAPSVPLAIAQRYPVVICDEHQDADSARHGAVMHLLNAGAKLRVFGDPMQAIFGDGAKAREAQLQQWNELCDKADRVESLDYPHRWETGSPELGHWILAARQSLRDGNPIDLSAPRPEGLKVIVADNIAPRHGHFQLDRDNGKEVRNVALRTNPNMMVLSSQVETVRSIGAFLGRRIPIWEGHRREALPQFVHELTTRRGDPLAIAEALIKFVQMTCIGFSNSACADRLRKQVKDGGNGRATDKTVILRQMAQCIIAAPDHIGTARSLALLRENVSALGVEIDYRRELNEAIRLGAYEDAAVGLVEIHRRRSVLPPRMPDRSISTIHKAKGLESDAVLLMPCDKPNFGDTDKKRCLLYVALSRAKSKLTIVVSKAQPSKLFSGY